MYRTFAMRVAKEAGTLLLRGQKNIHNVEWKLRVDVKTEMDDKSDSLIRTRIHQTFPSHNILSEENQAIQQNSIYTWVVDPLDGTFNYMHNPTDRWSVAIALSIRKTPVMGVVYAPARREMFVAEYKKGAFLNGKRLHGSIVHMREALVGMDWGHARRSENIPLLRKLLLREGVLSAYSFGCASTSLGQVAQGTLHAYAAMDLGPWDMAAGAIINREAGNKVTDLSGKEWEVGDRSILAANPRLHKKLIRYLSD